MVEITFVQPNGDRQTVNANIGDSVMQAAVANNVDGIFAECGGAMMCATCHCYVDDGWADQALDRKDGEEDMLDCAANEVTDASRLSCQIRISAELDGLVIHLPEEQV